MLLCCILLLAIVIITGWNDKIFVQKKTTLQLYLKTFIEKINSAYLINLVELTSIQCSRLQPQSPPRYGSGTRSMPFPQAQVGAQRILGGWRQLGWLWYCGRWCWWCSRRMTKRSSPAGSGRGRRRGAVREGYKVVALLLKPSLGLFDTVGRRRVLLPHPGSATGHLIAPGDYHTLQHI